MPATSLACSSTNISHFIQKYNAHNRFYSGDAVGGTLPHPVHAEFPHGSTMCLPLTQGHHCWLGATAAALGQGMGGQHR